MQVPSAYLLTDTFLMLDSMLDKKMLAPTQTEGKLTLAGQEGVKLKKLLGALRNLWRSNKTKGLDDKITHLKSYLLASPSKHDDMEEEGLPEDLGENDTRGVGAAVSDCSGSEHASQDEGEDGAIVGRESSDNESGSEGGRILERDPAPSHAGSSGDESGSESESDAAPPPVCNSPTLRLGESPRSDAKSETSIDSSESSSSHRDSQVSSGRMGRAINHYTRAEEKQRFRQVVQDIHMDLESQAMSKFEGVEWDTYADYCLDTLRRFGESSYHKLASVDFFRAWCRNLKAQDAQFQSGSMHVYTVDTQTQILVGVQV